MDTLLSIISSDPSIRTFVERMSFLVIAALVLLPKVIGSWLQLRKGHKNERIINTGNELLLKQTSETVSHCSSETKKAVGEIRESIRLLLEHTSMLSELLAATDIKNLSTMLRKAISNMESLADDHDNHTKKLGHVVSPVFDSLRGINELIDRVKDKESHMSTLEVERKVDALIQLVNDTKVELAKITG